MNNKRKKKKRYAFVVSGSAPPPGVCNISKPSWEWWYVTVVPASQEIEVGRTLEPTSSRPAGKCSKTSSQRKKSLITHPK
jgi:hypothetical protein